MLFCQRNSGRQSQVHSVCHRHKKALSRLQLPGWKIRKQSKFVRYFPERTQQIFTKTTKKTCFLSFTGKQQSFLQSKRSRWANSKWWWREIGRWTIWRPWALDKAPTQSSELLSWFQYPQLPSLGLSWCSNTHSRQASISNWYKWGTDIHFHR